MTDYEKRNPTQAVKPEGASPHGVGGRHSSPPTCRVGGGYPDICTKKKREVKDFQMADLHALRLQRHWLEIAVLIGVENFIAMWRVLCQEVDSRGDSQRIYIPRFSKYLRLQRNRVIMTLRSEGKKPKTIRKEYKAVTGQDVSIAHIWKIINQGKKATDDR